ncbi:hypothetical protein AAHC03_04887 [Spirometra sp. Aus1]
MVLRAIRNKRAASTTSTSAVAMRGATRNYHVPRAHGARDRGVRKVPARASRRDLGRDICVEGGVVLVTLGLPSPGRDVTITHPVGSSHTLRTRRCVYLVGLDRTGTALFPALHSPTVGGRGPHSRLTELVRTFV